MAIYGTSQSNAASVAATYKAAESNQKASASKQAEASSKTTTPGNIKKLTATPGVVHKDSEYGRTIGEPKLSDTAKKYYDELKKKYGSFDFILVSKDEKDAAMANAARYANPNRTVVLIDEEKIEKMATDPEYRKKYEGILSGAKDKIEQLKNSMNGSNVAGFGMQVNDDGSTSFFAVLKKSSAEQKARIERKSAENKAHRKEEAKKAQKKANDERIKNRLDKSSEGSNKINDKAKDRFDGFDEDDYVTIKADSLEELIDKVGEFTQNDMFNSVRTQSEQMVGQNIDFKG